MATLCATALLSVQRPCKAESLGDHLARVRSDAALGNNPSEMAALAREADAAPPGPVRADARLVVAEAWLGRMNRPQDALGLLAQIADDPFADSLERRLAERERVGALVTLGRLQEASEEAWLHRDLLDAPFVRQVVRLARRVRTKELALVELALFWVATAVTIARSARASLGLTRAVLAKFAPLALAFACYVGLAGGFLASSYETGNAAPFLALGVACLPLLLAARAWSAVGSTRPIARAGRALACALSVVAAAFVVLDTINPTYLDGFGL